jgi:hypothetical protein
LLGSFSCLVPLLWTSKGSVWGRLLMALNTIFCHQHKAIKYIKSIEKQHFMFRFHLVPLVLGEPGPPSGVSQRPTWPYHVSDPWESQVAHPGVPIHRWFESIWSKGGDEAPFDPWVHHHTLGGFHWLNQWLSDQIITLPAM